MSFEWLDRGHLGKIEATFSAIQGQPVTFHCWAKWDDDGSTNDDCILQLSDNALSADVMRMGLTQGGDELQIYFGVSNQKTTSVMVDATWHSCIMQWNAASSFDVWLDGDNGHNSWGGISFTTLDTMTIGREGDSSDSDSWQGKIAEVSVWDKTLSAAERAHLDAGFSALLLTSSLANLNIYEPLDSPTLNRHLIHADSPTFAAGSGGPTTGEGSGTAPLYNADHPVIYHSTAQILQFPPAAAPPAGLGVPIAAYHHFHHNLSQG